MIYVSIISFTENGSMINRKLGRNLQRKGYNAKSYSIEKYAKKYGLISMSKLSEWTKTAFDMSDIILFIGAVGIAVRAVAPYIKDKFTDPAVIVVDEKALYTIPIIGGHMGGANEFSKIISDTLGSQLIITTATDINHKFAVDVFAKKNELNMLEKDMTKEISSEILSGKKVAYICDVYNGEKLPDGLTKNGKCDTCVCVSIYTNKSNCKNTIHLVPRKVHIGIGCRKDTEKEKLLCFVTSCLKKGHIFEQAVSSVSSIDIKHGEKGLIDFAADKKWPLYFFSAEKLNTAKGKFSSSVFVKNITGTDNVCERAAVLASNGGEIIIKKISHDGMTFAAACEKWGVVFE
ncbi:MAG: cobalamin biosynthesis protein [Clostridia bacterium]|jgi:cobalt-precorrin 5A hydrolase|nr:cobalamin biosynthesis protein [Clostridia bacterium]